MTRLRNEETDVVPEDGGVAIEEVGGQVDHDRQLRQLFQQLAGGDGAVVARSASDQQQTTAPSDFRNIILHNNNEHTRYSSPLTLHTF